MHASDGSGESHADMAIGTLNVLIEDRKTGKLSADNLQA